jgi:hypothetical protein
MVNTHTHTHTHTHVYVDKSITIGHLNRSSFYAD